MAPASNHGDRLLTSAPLNPDQGTSSAQPSRGLLLWLPHWSRRVSEMPGQQLGRFSSPSPRPARTAISAPYILEQESTIALTGVTGMCLAGREGFLLWFNVF